MYHMCTVARDQKLIILIARFLIVTSAKEVMFSPGFVCLSVNNITQTLMDGF